MAEIERRGLRQKSWRRKQRAFREGGPFTLNSLRRLMGNIVYNDAVRQKGQRYAGEHAAILEAGQWERVQSLIATRSGVSSAGNGT